MTADEIVALFKPDKNHEIKVRHEGEKTFISLFVKQHPYHDDNMDFVEMDFSKKTISFFEQYRIVYQELIKKTISDKDDYKRLEKCYEKILEKNDRLTSERQIINTLLKRIHNVMSPEDLKFEFISSFFRLNFKYKEPKDSEKDNLEYFVDKTIKVIIGKYTESLVYNNKFVISFEDFNNYCINYNKNLSSALNKIKNSVSGYLYGKQIVERIKPFIKSEYMSEAELRFVLNCGEANSVNISLENNPWRNGVIKGDMLFSRIKAEGKLKYILFKDTLSYSFYKAGIQYSANKTEQKNGLIRIALDEFTTHLQNGNDIFRTLMTSVFLRAISFSEFGCCSKYAECEKQGKCLHCDQLYATACQWQKYLKRTGIIEDT